MIVIQWLRETLCCRNFVRYSEGVSNLKHNIIIMSSFQTKKKATVGDCPFGLASLLYPISISKRWKRLDTIYMVFYSKLYNIFYNIIVIANDKYVMLNNFQLAIIYCEVVGCFNGLMWFYCLRSGKLILNVWDSIANTQLIYILIAIQNE